MKDKIDMTSLYRHFSRDGDLLYIGISLNHMARLAQHKDASHWYWDIHRVEVVHYNSRAEALKAEAKAICDEKPIHNVYNKTTKLDRAAKRAQSEASRQALLNNLVNFKPIYTLDEAAKLLYVSKTHLLREIESGNCGGFKQPQKFWTSNQVRAKTLITGWDVIDYLEYLSSKKRKDESERSTQVAG